MTLPGGQHPHDLDDVVDFVVFHQECIPRRY
jgi:hypothetical protein